MLKIDYKIALRNFLVRKKLLGPVSDIYRFTHFLAEGDPFKQMRKSGIAPSPKSLIFEPTMRCNLNCSMCYLNTRKIAQSGELSTADIEKMVKRLPVSIEHVSITGGEPTLRQDLREILHIFRKRGLSSITLMTNGTLPEKLKQLLDDRLITAVQLSLDGPKEMHNSIRNSPRCFDSFLESLNTIKRYKNVYIYILAVISEVNLEALAKITEFCKEHGIVNLTFEFEKRYDPGCIAESIDALKAWSLLKKEDFLVTESGSTYPGYQLADLKRCVQIAENSAKRLRFKNQYLPYSFLKNMPHYYNRDLRKCFKLHCRHLLTVRIDPRGNIIPCFGMRKPMGSLLNGSFEDIWNSEGFLSYRKLLLKNNLLPLCETCHRAESFDMKFGRIN